MNSQSKKRTKTKHSESKQSIFSRLKSRKIILPTLIAAIAFMIVSAIPVFASTVVRSTPIPYDKASAQDASIELGDSQVRQAGSDGKKEVTLKVKKSLLNILFGGGAEEEISSKVTTKPVQELVVTGTRKYQYMYCSDGTYRYYNDDQFKNPTTGFTQKSPDDCAKNSHGTKTQLADGPPGSNKVANVTPYIPSNCSKTPIPYSTSYQNVTYLSPGVTSSYGGYDGYKVTCSADSTGSILPGYTIQPINKVVYVGVGSSSTPSVPSQNSQARQKCISDYNAAIAQLRLGNAMNSSAKAYLDQLYAQCLSRAGY